MQQQPGLQLSPGALDAGVNGPAPDSTAIATIRMMTEGGATRIAPDTLQGDMARPLAEGEPAARVATLETLWDFFINNVPDPDTALQQDINFDERLRKQPDVHAAMRKREITVSSYPWSFKPSTDKNVDPIEAQAMADYCTDVWKGMGNAVEIYRQMQNAVLMGGQGGEFVWAKDATGVLRPVSFWGVHKTRLIFDRLGNMALLTREAPVWGAYVGVAPTQVNSEWAAWYTPPGRFIYHKYMAEGGPYQRPAAEGYHYWGRGEDTNLYHIVLFDQFVLRFRLKWLEKHGMPLTLLYYTEGVANPNAVRSIAKAIRDESVVLIPRLAGKDGKESIYSLDFVTPPPIGHDAFATFTREWTTPAVEKILLAGADQMSLADVGGQSATMNQREAGEAIVFRYDSMIIDNTISIQLVPHIIRQVPKWKNVPLAHMPTHCITPEKEKNRIMALQILTQAAQLVPVKESDVYDAAGLQKPKMGEDGVPEEATVFLGQPVQPGMEDMMPQGAEEPGEAGGMTSDSPQQEKKALTAATKFDPKASFQKMAGRNGSLKYQQNGNTRSAPAPQK